ncbi:MAG: DUF4296 domain-containing protein [Bacteroidales bacterium]
MNKYLQIITLFTIFLMSMVSCHNNKEMIDKPDDLIHQDTLVKILVDVHKVDAAVISSVIDKDMAKEELYYSVFQKYDVDEDQFNRTIRYYTVNDIEELQKLYDNVLADLGEEKAELTQKLQE